MSAGHCGNAESMAANLESAAHAEDTVVGLLGRETLEGEEDDLGLLGDEIIGPVVGGRNVSRASGWTRCRARRPMDRVRRGMVRHGLAWHGTGWAGMLWCGGGGRVGEAYLRPSF